MCYCQKTKHFLKLDVEQFLEKSINILNNETKKLIYKKLEDNDDLEENFITELKDGLSHFMLKDCVLKMHFKALNLNRSKTLKKKVKKLLRERFVKLRRYEEQKFYKEGVNMLLTCATAKKPAALLAQFLSVQLKNLKYHNFFLYFIKDSLNLLNKNALFRTRKIKIKIKGRLNTRRRANSRVFKIGKDDISVVTIDSIIDYSEKTAFTRNGTLGIKI